MTTPQAGLVPAHVTRFLLLAELCRTLGEHGCTSCLVNPAHGSAVLRVAREGRHGEWLDVGSVERADDDWIFMWEKQWGPVDRMDEIARHIVRTAAR